MKLPLGIIICAAALCQTAHANLINPVSGNLVSNESTANIIAFATGAGGPLSGLSAFELLRLDQLALPSAGSPFSVTYVNGVNPNSGATVAWNLTGTGTQLAGVYISGANGATFFSVSPDQTATSGSVLQTISAPANSSGAPPTVSHLLFLGLQGEGGIPPTGRVPDGGTTLVLLGVALTGLGWCSRSVRAKA